MDATKDDTAGSTRSTVPHQTMMPNETTVVVAEATAEATAEEATAVAETDLKKGPTQREFQFVDQWCSEPTKRI